MNDEDVMTCIRRLARYGAKLLEEEKRKKNSS